MEYIGKPNCRRSLEENTSMCSLKIISDLKFRLQERVQRLNFWTRTVNYEIFTNSPSKKEGHEILANDDFANSCREFGRTKNSYS